ncbi:hypothetical protein PQ472_00035 [Lacticaseibacillus pabuli]|uniref:Uncharacterized protein n=1 Tax=Lacticaseibacillus pabuli TaxID=3025672 RepID=A0ABY7WS87_9LACO|nr:hypothetical protein [Lacticaseibacillus sp. KACC 23028]WDF82669.1 hypothetical protein PQ472_00035 [Lacticaseibacillus sp. KACC 23028]
MRKNIHPNEYVELVYQLRKNVINNISSLSASTLQFLVSSFNGKVADTMIFKALQNDSEIMNKLSLLASIPVLIETCILEALYTEQNEDVISLLRVYILIASHSDLFLMFDQINECLNQFSDEQKGSLHDLQLIVTRILNAKEPENETSV